MAFLLRSAFLLVAILGTFKLSTAGETRFTIVESSPGSWVARGLADYTITPNDGWQFKLWDEDNVVGVDIELPSDTEQLTLWNIRFAGPNGERVGLGVYEDFERYPFNLPHPGVWFLSSGRGDNSSTGSFEILEITSDSLGKVTSFAANLTYFGEKKSDHYAKMEIRFNAAVPEPSAIALVSTFSLASFGAVRRLRTWPHAAFAARKDEIVIAPSRLRASFSIDASAP